MKSLTSSVVFVAILAVFCSLACAQAPLPVVRTFVHHEISAFTNSPNQGSGGRAAPMLSANGNRIAFAHYVPATNRIFVMNSDGSGQQQVDSYTALCNCSSMVDISADGSKIVSSDSVQLRISDSAGARSLLALDSNNISDIRISGDGTKV